VTEQEAFTKWCPFVRHVIDESTKAACNRDPDTGNPDRPTLWNRCLGSECMAWRWVPHGRQLLSAVAREGWDHISAEDSEDGHECWIEPEDAWIARWHGFCGLAGKP
jgi:hypothetical protein